MSLTQNDSCRVLWCAIASSYAQIDRFKKMISHKAEAHVLIAVLYQSDSMSQFFYILINLWSKEELGGVRLGAMNCITHQLFSDW